jgi:itaconyl-CoA hydratase
MGVLMPIKQGWTGRLFEDFEVGDVYQHPLGRTVIAADNIWFTLLTQNTNPIHFDRAYASHTEYGKPLVDSTFTLALVTGQSVMDISQNAMANLGWDEVRLPNPLFEGDTVYSRSEVLEKRESKSRPNVGIVRFKTTGYKQDGAVVIEFKRTVMVYRRGHVPQQPPVPKRAQPQPMSRMPCAFQRGALLACGSVEIVCLHAAFERITERHAVTLHVVTGELKVVVDVVEMRFWTQENAPPDIKPNAASPVGGEMLAAGEICAAEEIAGKNRLVEANVQPADPSLQLGLRMLA